MAITIDATVGGASANSFDTLANWTTYMECRLNSDAFDDATTDNKNRALAEAARLLSALAWSGGRADDVQALAWPRQWASDPDSPIDAWYDIDEIPGRVKRAQYELAFEFLKAGTTDVAQLGVAASEIRRTSIAGAIETEYYERGARLVGLERYPAVMREIGPLLATTSRISARTVRT